MPKKRVTSPHPSEPEKDCLHCTRLVEFRKENQALYPDFFNGAVQSFGPVKAEYMILGLAPGLKGANKTGRPFTGDFSGELLYKCLDALGWSNKENANHPRDGYQLKNALVTNAVRCVPPQNKPTTAEVHNCRPFLLALIKEMPNLKVIFALGKIAHDTALRTFGLTLAHYKFSHAATHRLPNGLVLVDSYHCSRYNVNTGVLTEDMFLTALKEMKKVTGH